MISKEIDECFEKGFLRKTEVSENLISNSIRTAERFLERARGNMKIGYYDMAFLAAYNSMFHSARFLLFRKRVKERSHYCMISYLKEEFKSDGKISRFLEIMDDYRIMRHKVQYSGNLCSFEDADESIKDASDFLSYIKNLGNK